MGSDESHFNVSVGSDGQSHKTVSTRQCPQTTTFLKRKESQSGIKPRGPPAYQPNALPLGQTGSRHYVYMPSYGRAFNVYDDLRVKA